MWCVLLRIEYPAKVCINIKHIPFCQKYQCFNFFLLECTEYQSSCPTQSDPFNLNGGEAASKEFPHMVKWIVLV